MPPKKPLSIGQLLHQTHMTVAETDALAARTITDPRRRIAYFDLVEDFRRAVHKRMDTAAALHGSRIRRARKALLEGKVTPETYMEDASTSAEAFRMDQLKAAADYVQAVRMVLAAEATNDPSIAEAANQFLLQRKADHQ